MQRSALCRSRRELSNEYLLAKIGVDTAENEPLEVWGKNSIQYSIVSLATAQQAVSCAAGWARGRELPALSGRFSEEREGERERESERALREECADKAPQAARSLLREVRDVAAGGAGLT